jgi:hypothetical protein
MENEERLKCDVHGCEYTAVYETWARNHDSMGLPTGMNIRVHVCEEHKSHPWLVCNQKRYKEKRTEVPKSEYPPAPLA